MLCSEVVVVEYGVVYCNLVGGVKLDGERPNLGVRRASEGTVTGMRLGGRPVNLLMS